MNSLLVLLTILWFKRSAADECIRQVVAIFSAGYSGNELNILTKDKHFIIKKVQIHNPPFLNLNYDTIEVFEVNRRLSEQFDSIIDIDYFRKINYALKREHKTVRLVRLDLDTGQMLDEGTLNDPDAQYLKSFVIADGQFSFYFHLGNKMWQKNYRFFLDEERIALQLDGEQREFQFNFSKVAYLNSTGSDLKYAFLRDLDLYLTNQSTIDANQPPNRYNVINVNRLTNCLATLCTFKKIDGFIHYADPDGDRSRHAVLVNNNYFFVPDIININGSTPVSHFRQYERVRFAFTCEVLFTLDKENYCFRNKKFYKIEYANDQFEIQVLVATAQNPFVDNFNLSPGEFLDKWLQFKERPVAVLKLSNRAAVLFASSYTIWTATTKSYETKDYENLFPNHDRENQILSAFYDQATQRYLFVGSKFNFIYRHKQLNVHNQFFENLNKLTQPLYTNCVERLDGENSFIMALIMAIFICFVLIILLIICIYLKHCRHRMTFQPQATEQVPDNLKNEVVFGKKKSQIYRSTRSKRATLN